MKKLLWAIVIIALIIYSVIVYGWVQEGNRNFEKMEQERNAEGL